MKLIKVFLASIMCLALAVATSGCSIGNFFSADSLLRPPKAIGDDAEIEKLISDTAKSNYTLKYPKNGSYRSAIIMADLNNDEQDEAIVFFRNGNDTALIHMLVMYSDNDEWKLSADIVAEAADIDRVDFADIDSDNDLEILAGYTTYTTNINRLLCYSYKSGKTEEIHSDNSYSSFYTGDFDNDGNSEVISLLLYTTETEANAALIDYSESNNSLYTKAMASMDPNVVKYKSAVVSELGDKTTGLITDGSYANDELCTQVVYYDRHFAQLKNLLYNEKVKNPTHRGCNIISKDIDGDGIMEIPVVSALPFPKDDSSKGYSDMITWSSFEKENNPLSAKLRTIADYNYGYCFKCPDKWIVNSVTAKSDKTAAKTMFYSWNGANAVDELFEIKVFAMSDWDSGKADNDYTLISKNDKYAFTFKNIKTDLPVSLTDDEIKTGFISLNESAEQSELK